VALRTVKPASCSHTERRFASAHAANSRATGTPTVRLAEAE
jgi:hypothetical protein